MLDASLDRPLDLYPFLAGGGEMGERIRNFDWTTTPLGPIDSWPQDLRSALSICLNSNFPIAIYWGPELVLLYNDQWSSIPGEKHPWALGQPAHVAWPEIWHIIQPLFEQVVVTGQATRSRDQLLPMHRHGFTEECYFDYTFSPIRGESGQVEGVFNAVLETTSRVIGERRLRTLRELGQSSTVSVPTALAACRNAIEVLKGNPFDLPQVAIYLLNEGQSEAVLAGQAGFDAIGVQPREQLAVDQPELSALADLLATTRPVQLPSLAGYVANIRTDCDLKQHQAVLLPITRPNLPGLAGFIIAGISPNLLLNDDYRGFLDLLSGHVSATVNNAVAYQLVRQRADSLAEIDKAKTVFFSNISHEFRTPLTLMLGPIEDLLNSSNGRLPDEALSQLELVHRNGLRMLRLVNTLLDFSRIEAGRFPMEATLTDVARFTNDLASVFRSIIESAGLELHVHCDKETGLVPIDRDMWEKIVLNLISNAYKYTLQGSISVQLQRTGDCIELQVSDTGIGIPADDLTKIFDRFHRVSDARGRTHEGSGIGLSLVHELVKLHGGTIAVTSRVGEGTCFRVTIPVTIPVAASGLTDHEAEIPCQSPAGVQADWSLLHSIQALAPLAKTAAPVITVHPSDAASAVSESHDGLNSVRSRVLVADDNDDMRLYIMRMLSQEYDVRGVADGQAALDLVSHWRPDLVLTDVMMPNLDGFGLLKELRANPLTANLPIIMLSARAGEECQVEGLQAGVDDYLVKPFSARELMARVGAHIQLQRQRRQAESQLQRNAERLRLLWEAAAVLLTTDEPDVMLRQIYDKIRSNFRLDGYFNFIVDETKSGLRLLSCAGVPDEIVTNVERIRFGQAVCGCVAERCHPIIATNVQQSDAEIVQLIKSLGIRAYACFPLMEAGKLLGTLSFASAQRDCFESDELEFFQTICQYVTAAYIRLRLISELRQAHQRKDEFLATLAHELRNPMAPIRNGVQLLKMVGIGSPSTGPVLEMMERQLQQLVHLVDDLLDISRISRGKIELRKERITLSSAIEQAIETSRPLIEGAQHDLRVDQPAVSPWVDADKTRLAQVFSNLLNNSAKYTEPGGQIVLTVRVDGDWVNVDVRDNGVGIPQHKLPLVFEMFTQVDRDLNRSQGGLGIGLAIVKQLVEMHGGRVEVASGGHGCGSQFTVRLPLAQPADAAPVPALTSPHDANSHRILVVDDNQDAANSLALMLRLLGNDARTAHDGTAALALAEQFRPELVVLDIGMPGMNGYEVAQAIRQSPWGRDMTLAALTGWGQEEDRRKSQAAGFNAHLVKPIEPKILRNLIESLN